jgi:hypothetical protein
MLFSGYPFSTQPFSATGREVRAYFDMVLDLAASFAFTLYVTSRAGYATRPTDTLPSQPFRGVLQSYSFSRSILQQDIGTFTTGTGKLVIANTDAHYDFLQQDYTVNARPVKLNIGRVDASYNDAFTLARLTSTGWNVNGDQVEIDLVDYSYKLDVPMQPNVYGGTGGADGGDDIAGKRKQLLFGYCRNVSMLQVVPSLLIFQANDGSMQEVVAVYDRGSPLTFYANYATFALLAATTTIPAGYYATCLAEGFIRIDADPNGEVTADIRGMNAQGYIVTTSDIARWAIRNRTAIVDPDELDVNSFDQLNVIQPAAIDYCIRPDDSVTVAAFIANIMNGVGGWGGHLRNGLFHVRRFQAPTGNPVAAFSRKDMVGDIVREALPSAYVPPPWRWRLAYARSWTVQTDLDAAVSADHKSFVSESFRVAEASNAAVKVDYPFAQDRDPVESYFSYQPDAAAEAVRRLALFLSLGAVYRQSLPRRALRLNMGDEITITHERFDLSQGKNMIVVDMNETVSFIEGGAVDSVQVAACG